MDHYLHVGVLSPSAVQFKMNLQPCLQTNNINHRVTRHQHGRNKQPWAEHTGVQVSKDAATGVEGTKPASYPSKCQHSTLNASFSYCLLLQLVVGKYLCDSSN